MGGEELYRAGRHSAPVRKPGQDASDPAGGAPDRDLIGHLRDVRNAGVDSMRAAEEYEPDLCVDLSARQSIEAVDRRLAEWHDKRVATLDRVRAELRHVWAERRSE